MSSRKEEERNEKIIRGLLKLPPNRRCINCNSLGPQYVCTNFWTFICTACSGIQKEKSCSSWHVYSDVRFLRKVASQIPPDDCASNAWAMQALGKLVMTNKVGKDSASEKSPHHLSCLNKQCLWPNLPQKRLKLFKKVAISNPGRIREFIRGVYVDKKYAGGRTSDKPPLGIQSHKNFEEEHRRASSYHSYSQSPPYDHQYEDRRYGKQTGILSRKPGSDRGLYEGKIASFICSPGSLGDQMYEDRFANEISGPRISDYSASSAGDTFKFDGQSPNFQSDIGYGSPQPVRDILIEDGRRHIPGSYSEASVRRNVETVPRPQRTASSGSFDGKSVSLKSVNSGSFQEIMIESELATAGQPVDASFSSGSRTSASTKPSSGDTSHPPLVQNQANSSASSIDLFAEINQPSTMSSFVEKSLPLSALHGNSGNEDPFGPPFVQNAATSSVPSLDLFAKINQPSSSVATLEKTSLVPFSQEEGWATFDVPHAGTASQTKITSNSAVAGTATSTVPSLDKQGFDAFPLTSNNGQWLSAQNSISHESFAPAVDQWGSTSNEVKIFSGPTCSQTWNAFDDSFGNFPQPPFGSLPVKSDVQVPPHAPPTIVDPCMNLTVQEESGKDGLRMSSIDGAATGMSSSLDNIVTGPSFNPVIPPMGTNGQECKSTNPFDLPYESDLESSNGFSDMSSLQASLPPVQFPSPFLSGLGQPWYSQNPVPPYISSVSSGGLAYVAGQSASTQLPDVSPQGPVAPLGGNPFA
ncbi:hypothetical protein Taro_041067 [Colocasia esculenta]|uniref:Arf-GAP domain-containing protein n=1 Tax=Colocasia esculenta TaxID=4460 RepID=A0A843WZQ8_COLES|nr:hypothetical protein [Colocasia esculenta]